MPSAPEKLARVKDGWLQLAFLILRKDEREVALLATNRSWPSRLLRPYRPAHQEAREARLCHRL
jgi:hypothetical protein